MIILSEYLIRIILNPIVFERKKREREENENKTVNVITRKLGVFFRRVSIRKHSHFSITSHLLFRLLCSIDLTESMNVLCPLLQPMLNDTNEEFDIGMMVLIYIDGKFVKCIN